MTAARRPLGSSLLATLVALALSACGAGRPSPDGASGSPTAGITVFAAASLTGSFRELGRRFEAAHPGSRVTFSFGPSSGLATQIVAGAPADVFAAASERTMAQVVAAGLASSPEVFATTWLQLAVPPANPRRIDELDDLDDPGVKLVLCQEQVPCGAAADATLAKAGLTVVPVSREADVKAVLTKVSLGEADAGLVYVTDVRAAGGDVLGVPVPADRNTATTYPIAALTRSDADAAQQDASQQGTAQQATAQAFVEFVLSDAGAAVLAGAGFAGR
jgi:molybdate transport system substrate-binding protein